MKEDKIDSIQVKIIVKGRVQGVFFRAETKNAADKLGVKGYVKNLGDGSVEAVFNGAEKIVTQMAEWCSKGPAAAKVEHLISSENEMLSNFKTFEIRY